MTEPNIELLKEEILANAKSWFLKTIAENHRKNTLKLHNSNKFDINPFLIAYLSSFFEGEITPESVAKVLIYPRALGTSITTSFGTNMQKFVSVVLKSSFGSTTPGIDIEFTDKVDGRKKYCQVKLGPNTINKDDVVTIHNHFSAIKNIARTNHLDLRMSDLVVGIIYGSETQVSSHYKSLRDKHYYPLYVGKNFWHRLTGDIDFYDQLVKSFASLAVDVNGKKLLAETIVKLSRTDVVQNLASKDD